MAYVLFDIGGTKTRVAVSKDLQTFSEPVKFKTIKSDFEKGIGRLCETIHEIVGDEPIDAVAGGIRGILNTEKTGIINDPGGKIIGWVGQDIVAAIGSVINVPTYLENDTAVVGLGEAHHGAGKGERIVVYHTVSTGVGGVRIVDGKVAESEHGFEPGHQILDVDRSVLGYDKKHTLEKLVSGSALEARAGKPPYEIDQADPVWQELAMYLGKGMKNTVTYWSPSIIVLGGSMIIGDPRILLEDIQKETEKALDGMVATPKMADATLGDYGGLYGAMELIRQKHTVT